MGYVANAAKAMNRDFINTYMQEKNIPSGFLKAWYNFESGNVASGIVYNQVHDINGHYFNVDNYDGDLKSNVLAGISVGDNDVMTTPGLFDYRELVQLSDDVDHNNWTIFITHNVKIPIPLRCCNRLPYCTH